MKSNPDYTAKSVKAGEKDKEFDIGVAHEDENGLITVHSKAIPLTNEILFVPKEEAKKLFAKKIQELREMIEYVKREFRREPVHIEVSDW